MREEPASSLLTRTRELLEVSEKTVPQIFKDTGLPFHWLHQFKQGRSRDPSVNRVQKLYEYLSGRQLEVH